VNQTHVGLPVGYVQPVNYAGAENQEVGPCSSYHPVQQIPHELHNTVSCTVQRIHICQHCIPGQIQTFNPDIRQPDFAEGSGQCGRFSGGVEEGTPGQFTVGVIERGLVMILELGDMVVNVHDSVTTTNIEYLLHISIRMIDQIRLVLDYAAKSVVEGLEATATNTCLNDHQQVYYLTQTQAQVKLDCWTGWGAGADASARHVVRIHLD
jgi:hypothetical protein